MISNVVRKLAGAAEFDAASPAPVVDQLSAVQRGAIPRPRWADDRVLCGFGMPGVDDFTIRDSQAGVLVVGITGSGKTSGSGTLLARSYLQAGFGGLVLCVKPDEANLWRRYAQQTGRSNDLVFFGSDRRWKFNFLDYEARRPGTGAGLSENLIHLITEMASIGTGEHGAAKSEDPFWDRAMRSLIRNLLDLLLLAHQPVTLAAMYDVLRSAPTNTGVAASQSWKDRSACYRLLLAAEDATCGKDTEADMEQVRGYWLTDFPGMPDKTRGSVVEMFRTMAEALLRGPIRGLFCDKTTIVPEHALAGKVIVVDLPVKQWGEVGRYAGVLWKYCLQKSLERRADNPHGNARPVMIWADEFQFFISKSDFLFQTTARSSRAATVYLTQTRSGLLAALGGEATSAPRVDALLANLNTKIFHANGDKDTNLWAAETIAKKIIELHGDSKSVGTSGGAESLSLSVNQAKSRNEQIDFAVQPVEFTLLKNGGPQNELQVEAIVFQTGRRWSSGNTWMKIRLNQAELSASLP